MMASFTGVEEFGLDETESATLAEAITNVTEMYDVKALSPEAMAWWNLATTAGGIYGPRMMSAHLRRKATKAQQKPAPVIIPRNAV